ncbi:uncharacterized protein CELE_T13A10.64 [Caenorhabditis elegans]|uniref:Uncharacterized protein n=1 Tax=Caenorhabditis elegans TaxID=6239 RepID=U4PF53_CAEEL|nr:Uncharacterized protein CELE_T13A10.64 [Caenorhabditis elegans]CDH93369.1 Uncharacterized protein CELE_T13A10.64 [Caenorhabditis elegans]|eukprot:NP_001294568.1 Uncharacterized protein CELE_T13A10.64 [Caenorhabditis elegans]
MRMAMSKELRNLGRLNITTTQDCSADRSISTV